MKFVHAADLHLDSPMRGLDRYEGAPVERMRGATRRALENLVEACIAEEVDFLVIAGDLYDGGWKDYSTGLFFAAQMSRLRDANIPVVLVRGNHDAQSQITKTLRLPDNVTELSTKKPETVLMDRLGVAIHGQGFATRAVTDDLAARYPARVDGAFNIGLLHTCAEGREGHERYAPCTVETLASKGYDYWALGHVHQREVLARSPWIVFPGNLQGRHARETGEKGATIVRVDDGVIASVEHRAFDVVRWAVCDVDARDARAGHDVVDLVRRDLERRVEEADGRPVAARVVIRGQTRAHVELEADPEKYENEIRAAATDVDGEGVWVEKISLRTRAPLDLDALRERDDAIGQLARSLRDLRTDDEGIKALMEDLSDLKRKLPLELREGGERSPLEDPAEVRDVLDDVEQILLPRLLYRDRSEAPR